MRLLLLAILATFATACLADHHHDHEHHHHHNSDAWGIIPGVIFSIGNDSGDYDSRYDYPPEYYYSDEDDGHHHHHEHHHHHHDH
jgi:hypothetical protein